MADPSGDVRSDALRLLTNGVYVVTTCYDDKLHATTITWVSQVSIHPPLILLALRRSSRLAHAVRKAHRFALNILAQDQLEIARTFFEHLIAPQDVDTMAGYGYRPSQAHCPLLLDALAWIECRLDAELSSPGDHTLMLGEITATGVRRAGKALVLADTPWSYGGLSQ